MGGGGVSDIRPVFVHGYQEDDFELLPGHPPFAPARGFAHGQHCRAVLELVHKLREYARHAPFCSYAPTYPDAPIATCDCGFDAVLDDYDRLAST